MRKVRQITRKGYQNYIKAYKQKAAALAKKGYSFYDTNGMYSFNEWKQMYTAKRLDRVDLVNTGKAKTVGNINQYLVADQAYFESVEQAKRIQSAAKILGENITLSAIRSNQFDWTLISGIYDELKNLGYSGNQAHGWISTNLFGSL